MENTDTKDTYSMIWRMYCRQKDEEANAGVEVKDDMNNMRRWMQTCVKGEGTDDKLEVMFGSDPVVGDSSKCLNCGGHGWRFSRHAVMKRRSRAGGYEDVRVPGMVVCHCFYGQQLNRDIANTGRKKPTPTKKRPT